MRHASELGARSSAGALLGRGGAAGGEGGGEGGAPGVVTTQPRKPKLLRGEGGCYLGACVSHRKPPNARQVGEMFSPDDHTAAGAHLYRPCARSQTTTL